MAEVRVGIVSWNTAELLDRCLAALPAALGGLDAEVVVVDNASTDNSVERARRHPGVVVVANAGNDGYAKAMDAALAGTDAPVLVALNPDTEPPPGSLAGLVEGLRARPDAGLVVPRLVHPDGRLQHSCYRFPSLAVAALLLVLPRRLQRGAIGRRWWLEGGNAHDRTGTVDWAIGAVHVLRAEALGDDPPYDPRWFMYAEDLDRCWGLRSAGWDVVLLAHVEVPHVGNASGRQRWGDARAARYWRATYDVVGRRRGRGYARLLALINALAVARVAATFGAAARLGGPGAAERRSVAAAVRSGASVHREVLRRGPPPPDQPPV